MIRPIIALLFALTSHFIWADESRPLRVGVSVDFEPMAYVISDEVQGIEIDFARMVAERIDRPLKVQIYSLKDLIPALERGEIDVIMSALSITEERRQRVRFTNPYMEIGQMGIVRTEDASKYGQQNALEEAEGLRVGVHQGSTGEAYVLEHLTRANMNAYEGVEQGLEGLRKQEIDVFVHDSTTSWQLSRSFLNDKLMSLNRFLTHESLAWAVSKDQPELQTTINLVLKDMKAQGEVRAVISRWLPVIPLTVQ